MRTECGGPAGGPRRKIEGRGCGLAGQPVCPLRRIGRGREASSMVGRICGELLQAMGGAAPTRGMVMDRRGRTGPTRGLGPLPAVRGNRWAWGVPGI